MNSQDPLADLPILLPALLQNSSIGRSQMIIDQVKTAIADGLRDQILLVTAAEEFTGDRNNTSGPPESADRAVAAAVVLRGPVSSNSGTVLIADAVCQNSDRTLSDTLRTKLSVQLSAKLRQELPQMSIRFLQWATDSVEPSAVPSASPKTVTAATPFPIAIDFTFAAKLRYLSFDLSGKATSNPQGSKSENPANTVHPILHTRSVDPNCAAEHNAFVDLVAKTYQATLDCPALAEFRSAKEIVDDYRLATAYCPSGWMTFHTESTSDPVGCLVMGMHKGKPGTDGVSELVYMGVPPEHRGQSIGKSIVQHACEFTKTQNAQRMILAVDVTNEPAITAYEKFGMTSVMEETVWIRRI